MGSITNWINNGDGFPIDWQNGVAGSDTVCIDPELGLYHGSMECLDEPDWVFLIVILFFHDPNLTIKKMF